MASSDKIAKRLAVARSELDRLRDERQRLQSQLAKTQDNVLVSLRDIRGVIIDAIKKGERFDWTDTDEQVTTLFNALNQRGTLLAEQLQDGDAEAQSARARVHAAIENHEQMNQQLEELDARIEAATSELPAVQRIRKRIEEITLLTERLTNQKEDAERDAVEKRSAYENDRFFRYLWKRGYGQDAYQAGALARRFDRWLAEQCHYRENAVHYELLLSIPPRLQATIEQSTAELNALQLQVDHERTRVAVQMERPALRQTVEQAAQVITTAKTALAAVVQRMERGHHERKQIESGEHQFHRDITDLVSRCMTNANLARFVSTTISTRDDQLLQQYETECQRQSELQARLATNGAVQQMQLSEVEELDRAWERAKRLEEQALLATMRHSRGHHYGGFGGGFGGGRGGGFGGGGFGRGGGFGGGGFKSGGRF